MFAVSSFILRFASAFLLYRGNSSRHIHPSTPLCKRCCKNILRINERSLRNFSLDEKEDFFVFFSHSLRRYYDWKIIILLSMEFAIFLYILSRVKSCFLHFLDLSNVTFEGNDSSTCGTNAIDFDKIKESRI